MTPTDAIDCEILMSVPTEKLKSVMSHVANTVTVVTANCDDGPIGVTMTAFVSISADPAVVLVAVEKTAMSLQPMLDAQGFWASPEIVEGF